MNPEMFDVVLETIKAINKPFAILGILMLLIGVFASRKIKCFVHQIRRG